MKNKCLQKEIDKIFSEAIDVNDTIWYSETQTLRDAIFEVIDKYICH